MIEIIEITDFKPDYVSTVQQLTDQLTSSAHTLTDDNLKEIIGQEHTHLFFLKVDDTVAGMLTTGIYYSPTGSKAWIEDVVIDEHFRGKGLSKQLMLHTIRFLKTRNIAQVMLTSKPARIVANQLYQKLGFEKKETNVYRMKLE